MLRRRRRQQQQQQEETGEENVGSSPESGNDAEVGAASTNPQTESDTGVVSRQRVGGTSFEIVQVGGFGGASVVSGRTRFSRDFSEHHGGGRSTGTRSTDGTEFEVNLMAEDVNDIDLRQIMQFLSNSEFPQAQAGDTFEIRRAPAGVDAEALVLATAVAVGVADETNAAATSTSESGSGDVIPTATPVISDATVADDPQVPATSAPEEEDHMPNGDEHSVQRQPPTDANGHLTSTSQHDAEAQQPGSRDPPGRGTPVVHPPVPTSVVVGEDEDFTMLDASEFVDMENSLPRSVLVPAMSRESVAAGDSTIHFERSSGSSRLYRWMLQRSRLWLVLALIILFLSSALVGVSVGDLISLGSENGNTPTPAPFLQVMDSMEPTVAPAISSPAANVASPQPSFQPTVLPTALPTLRPSPAPTESLPPIFHMGRKDAPTRSPSPDGGVPPVDDFEKASKEYTAQNEAILRQ